MNLPEGVERIRSIFDLPGISVAFVGFRGEILETNHAFCHFLGYPEGGLNGLSVGDITHPEELENSLRFYATDGAPASGNFSYKKRYLRKDGRAVWGQVSAVWLPGETRGLVLVQDITDSQKAQERVAAERTFLQSVVDSLVDPIKVIALDHQILTLNRAAKNMLPTGAQEQDVQICHLASRQCQLPCNASGGTCNLKAIQASGQPVRTIQRHRFEAGEEHVFEVTAAPLRNEEGALTGIVETARNITEILQAEAKVEEHEKRLEYITHYDLLTRLPNRTLLADRLHQTLARARRGSGQVAVLLLDLDRFRKINDSLGRRAGDLLLSEVARRLGLHVRQADTLARLGGDEFVAVLEQFRGMEHLVEVTERLLEDLSQEMDLDGVSLYVSASVGISLFPEDAGDVDGLLRCADAAMQRAQVSGGGTYQFFHPDMAAHSRQRLELEGQLRQALREEQFILYYQPQIDLRSGRCVGTEALVRWIHPQRGMISPGAFIPLAEETGLIGPMGLWGLKTACLCNKALQDQGFEPIPVSVNISAGQLYRTDFPATVVRILEETGLEARFLEIEITESMLLQDVQTAIAIMKELNTLGVSFAVDDFGTGYSSLSYLRQLPIHKLKIDQSFVRDLVADPNARAIAQAVVSLAKNLNFRVIAEGVETEEQAEILRGMGCYEIQGFLFSQPLPPRELATFIAGQKGTDCGIGCATQAFSPPATPSID